MRTTRYFDEQVLRKRPYLSLDLCIAAVEDPLRRERQEDGRHRIWASVTLPGDSAPRILRVVLLEDGETVHNAFIDRSFR